MKNIIQTVATTCVIAALALVSCDKKDTTPDNSNTTSNSSTTGTTTTGGTTGGTTTGGPPSPISANVNGVFVGLKSKVSSVIAIPNTTFTTANNVYSEAATATLYSTLGSTTAVDGGTISCNDSLMTKNSNNSYLFSKANNNATSAFTNFYNSGSYWNVQGNSTNGIPNITSSSGLNLAVFPSMPNNNYASALTVTTTSNFVVNHGAISNCDSLIYQIVGGNGTIFTSKARPGNISSYTFSTADMAALQATNAGPTPSGQLSVFAYKYKSVVINGKTYWIINITARTVLCNIKTN